MHELYIGHAFPQYAHVEDVTSGICVEISILIITYKLNIPYTLKTKLSRPNPNHLCKRLPIAFSITGSIFGVG